MFRSTDGRQGQPLLYAAVPAADEDADADSSRPARRPSPRPTLAVVVAAVAHDSALHARSVTPRPLSRPPHPHPHAVPTASKPGFSRRSTLRSRSPSAHARLAARKKYTYAAVFLLVSLVAFTIQTELAAYIQRDLGWDKAYCMLYLTHGSWALLWPVQLVLLRLRRWDMSWAAFWRRHVWQLRTTAVMVERQVLHPPRGRHGSPWPYLLRTTALVTTALTVAGLSWYVAVNKTTPSDLTAIYNCSAFFAYAFSVPLLQEPLRLDKSVAVAVAIVGVLVVAYGDTSTSSSSSGPQNLDGATRFVGNLIIGAGSILYGLYEVLYKRLACPPDGVAAGRGVVFANAFGSLVGLFTLLVLWVPLPVLHVLGWETFALPTGRTAGLLLASVVTNATFAGSFLVLISLTSPVLSSVAALLTIFIVAVADWLRTGEPLGPAALGGGCLIVVAFVMLSWSTWREMAEEERKREVDGAGAAAAEEEEEEEEDGHDDDYDDYDEEEGEEGRMDPERGRTGQESARRG
ncbi:hypothetical protein P8C59_003558 [Phyllachora maydis]|uniref:EamA domain-containing protein n=1 Tax=Phyllachora maydis TaxID=1825666 RepID=A0AAD9I0I3_9PEZI|nr:hypothetical protein P8C59_003558 [Phyllachora maydis]